MSLSCDLLRLGVAFSWASTDFRGTPSVAIVSRIVTLVGPELELLFAYFKLNQLKIQLEAELNNQVHWNLTGS